MCGRFSVSVDPVLLAERFACELPDGLVPRYNVAPTQPVLGVLAAREGGGREPRLLHWGLVPHWSRDRSGAGRMINARAETVAERPAFRSLLERRRCLIPADGFYEWRRDPDGRRRPLRFTLADGSPFAFAGLWATWRDRESGERLDSCTILTTTPNALVEPLHDRMPVILPREAEAVWLDRSVDAAAACALLAPLPAERMAMAEVSPLVNSPDNDSPDCLDPLAGPGGEQLRLA